jgi:excisionase family DNA binding protein
MLLRGMSSGDTLPHFGGVFGVQAKVSELLKIHHSTVYKMIREGRIPAFKIGSDWRFQKDQVVHWIAEQTIGTAQ